MGQTLSRDQWTAMWIFVGAIVVVATLGAVESLRPLVGGKPMSMVLTIQMFMLMAGALMVIFTKTNPTEIGKNEVFRAGMIAVVAVFGVAWMADTVFEANLPTIKASLSEVVKEHPWTYAVALLIVSKLVNSQAAAISAMVPVALSIGVPPGYVVAFAAACYGYYILPTYPSDLATIQFDRSGTTRIGKYVINHSFILPGLIGVSARASSVRPGLATRADLIPAPDRRPAAGAVAHVMLRGSAVSSRFSTCALRSSAVDGHRNECARRRRESKRAGSPWGRRDRIHSAARLSGGLALQDDKERARRSLPVHHAEHVLVVEPAEHVVGWESPQFRGEMMMKKSTLLVALSAASLASGLALAQTQPQNQPYSQTKPATPPPAMDSNAQSGGFSMSQLDKNKDGAVDRAEAKASASLTAIFDKADTNKDGKLDAAELSAASHMSSTTK